MQRLFIRNQCSGKTIETKCQCLCQVQPLELAVEELQAWLAEPAIDVHHEELLAFWRRKMDSYPLIGTCVRALFAAPGTNAASERGFSVASSTTEGREQMDSEHIAMLVFKRCNKAWWQSAEARLKSTLPQSAEEKLEWQRGEAEEAAELQRIEADAVEAFEANVVDEFQGADADAVIAAGARK